MTDQEKVELFNIIQETCEEYDVPLSTREDAEDFWQVLRYGYTIQEQSPYIKALKIIKEKKVNVGIFIDCCMRIDYQFYLDHHNFIMNGMSSEEFTEEEFDLLKVYLK